MGYEQTVISTHATEMLVQHVFLQPPLALVMTVFLVLSHVPVLLLTPLLLHAPLLGQALPAVAVLLFRHASSYVHVFLHVGVLLLTNVSLDGLALLVEQLPSLVHALVTQDAGVTPAV